MLLIYPPVAKPGEPPAGIAKLAGDLKANGHDCTILDANIEALYFLLEKKNTPSDTWSVRAEKNLARNLDGLKNKQLYSQPDSYSKAVREINRVLEQSSSRHQSTSVSLVNFSDSNCSPLKSEDLLWAANNFKENLYFPYFSKRISQIVKDHQVSTVGLSLNYLSQAITTFAIAGFLRCTYPSIRLIVGGGLITSWSSNPGWINPFTKLFDHWLPGCGSEKLTQLLQMDNPKSGVPDYTHLPLDKYLSPGLIMPYSTSSGCYWNKCSFCPEPAEKNPYLAVDSKRALDEINQLDQRYSPTLLHFLDNALPPAFLKTIVKQKTATPWYGFARISRELEDESFCHALRQSGCLMLKLGLESGSQQVLDAMNKGVQLDQMSLALNNLHRAGIATYVYLLFGTPFETYEDAHKTLEFSVAHHHAITFLNLAIFNMPLNSVDAKKFETSSFFKADLSLYCDFKHPHHWGRKQIRHFLDKEFKSHKKIAPIIHRDPPFFTSNHAPFLADNK